MLDAVPSQTLAEESRFLEGGIGLLFQDTAREHTQCGRERAKERAPNTSSHDSTKYLGKAGLKEETKKLPEERNT